MNIRTYKSARDLDAVERIFLEAGWIESGNDDHREGLRLSADDFAGLVVEIDGDAECYVATGSGTIRHTGTDLSLSAITAVATSLVARRQGLAQRLTAAAVARDAVAGAKVSAVGIFDQGFYNKLGFGTGSYERWHYLDPAHIRVNVTARPPKRLSKADWEAVHESRRNRYRGHGACNLDAPAATRAEMLWSSNGFGLGYPDGPDDAITHHIWFSTKEMENGPLNAWWMAYQTPEQFLELMALVGNLGDQVHLVRMCEPAGIQIQDLISQPFRRNRISEKSPFEARTSSYAHTQIRICDLEACVAAVTLGGGPIRFNLVLADPIGGLLDDDAGWRGIDGSYVVELGPESHGERGSDGSLPTLQASVGAFTRLWLGVLPATGVAVTDDLDGPAELLDRLNRALLMPVPKPDWEF